jgi:catechol 2,3-dioxygenase-like lactoylglutathione lyase family enzyme
MAHQVPHQHIENVIVQRNHSYTNHSYSNACLIAIANRRKLSSRKFSKEARMIRGIKFISIPVSNQDVSLKFFTEALGFKVVTDQPYTEKQRWIELSIPGAPTGLALFTPEGHEDRIGQFQSIAFWCDDLFATAKILKSKGVQFTSEPKKEEWGSSSVFKDPDGNQFALSSK